MSSGPDAESVPKLRPDIEFQRIRAQKLELSPRGPWGLASMISCPDAEDMTKTSPDSRFQRDGIQRLEVRPRNLQRKKFNKFERRSRNDAQELSRGTFSTNSSLESRSLQRAFSTSSSLAADSVPRIPPENIFRDFRTRAQETSGEAHPMNSSPEPGSVPKRPPRSRFQ